MKVLFVDNFDSFTYNIVHLLAQQGAEQDVVLSDDARLAQRGVLNAYDALVVGPGPGKPEQLPQVVALLHDAASRRMPVFGICLGLQAIAQSFGGKVVHAPAPMHGKTSAIIHGGTGLFSGLPTPFTATRYHSLCVDSQTLPEELEVTARSSDGVIQALAHRTLPVSGVQFHPESVLSEYGDRVVRNALGLRVTSDV
ncbi:MAG TPA: aminodeoxychorismate/anthranilate synthase component II [Candidatus Baltobacteraceae bacterium]|jgi:para-aminobenzoate synthetase component 2|nr:aminodeoxychorismate/anthranilate synthase component II [Candidatus Baltobacteraceae bacterium]